MPNIIDITGRKNHRLMHIRPRKGDTSQSVADISKAKRFIQYIHRVSLKDGLKALAKDYCILDED